MSTWRRLSAITRLLEARKAECLLSSFFFSSLIIVLVLIGTWFVLTCQNGNHDEPEMSL